ncbi:hypothetical protein GFS03_05695 [Sulfolobus sp. E5-1-F]|uniref:hypothetical protein n=1 Tax=Sulfolobaceae TaxID=118883 RepID=UPI001295E7B1|nr:MULTISPECIES: hypothetical protein [unclassified Sulfolobus]QGA54098.1 hypothetical protein GFS03_05695 [Sulfolobus sp. E5-1-F]QGA69159.1 hypothetical protein GFS33_10995 [Sulfolobus sp. E11-6]
MVDSKVLIKLLEDRPRPRGSKIKEEDLRRLAKLGEENVKLLEEMGCWKMEGEVIYYKTGCLGNYFKE